MSDKNNRLFSGKGYYIALTLCALAIGVASYVYYNNAAEVDSLQSVNTPVISTDAAKATKETKPENTTPAGKAAVPTEKDPASKPTIAKMATCSPVEGEILAEYAMECLGYNETTRDWRVHNGVDMAAQTGTEVHAAADGKVYTVYEDDQMGTTVVIRHDNGYTTKYASLAEEVSVAAGDTVKMGDAIGCVGSTALMEQALGDHVHFSVTKNDEPVDPQEFLKQ